MNECFDVGVQISLLDATERDEVGDGMVRDLVSIKKKNKQERKEKKRKEEEEACII